MPNFGIHIFSQFWWLALLGLLIPLFIHLWNRKEGARILVGSIHWLEESEEKKASNLKFSEWWRFILRLAILSLFLLLLLHPFLKSTSKAELDKKWVLLDPAINLEPSLNILLDSFNQEGHSIRIMPSLKEIQPPFEPDNISKEINYWSLLRKIANSPNPPDHLIIVAQPKYSQFIGQKPKLPFSVEWIDIPQKGPKYFLATAWQHQDQVIIILGHSSEEGISFTPKSIATINQKSFEFPPFPKFKLQKNEVKNHWEIATESVVLEVKKDWTKSIYLKTGKGFAEEAKFLLAALKAVSKYANFNLELKDQFPEASNAKLDWIIHLSDEKPDATTLERTRNLLIYEREEISENSFFKDQGTHFSLTKTLTADHISDLPAHLLNILLKEEAERLDIPDLRFVDINQRHTQIFKDTSNVKSLKAEGTSFQIWIWLFLLLLFLIERLYSMANE